MKMIDELPPIKINGKSYPLWSQFVHRKAEWIGLKLQDLDMGGCESTKIKDITLEPNGTDSAMFTIEGEEYSCSFDVQYGVITSGDSGWITFAVPWGGGFRIESAHLTTP